MASWQTWQSKVGIIHTTILLYLVKFEKCNFYISCHIIYTYNSGKEYLQKTKKYSIDESSLLAYQFFITYFNIIFNNLVIYNHIYLVMASSGNHLCSSQQCLVVPLIQALGYKIQDDFGERFLKKKVFFVQQEI